MTKNDKDLNGDLLLIDRRADRYKRSQPMTSFASGAVARKRWRLLADILKNGGNRKTSTSNNNGDYDDRASSSVSRKFQNLGLANLVEELPLANDSEEFVESRIPAEKSSYLFCRATFPDVENSPCVKLRLSSHSIDGLQDLVGFNNTGNVRIWSSEEMMTYFCLVNANLFENKSVVELGAGMTGLTSFFLAKSSGSNVKRIVVTDGNEKSAENLKVISSLNSFPAGVAVETRRLIWSCDEEACENLHNRFDVCLAADCFFFENDECSFLKTVDRLLKPNGIGLFFAPLRNGTFLKFVESVRKSKTFEIRHISDDYCPQITKRIKERFFSGENSQFDYNAVYPLMLEIQKRNSSGEFYENFSAASDILVDDDDKVLKFQLHVKDGQ